MTPPPAPRRRLAWYDWLLLALAAAAVGYLAWRADTVLTYRWNWSAVPGFLVRWDAEGGRWVANILLQGLFTTLRLAFWGIIAAGLIGVAVGALRVARDPFLRMASRSYVELVRNVPPLVFLFVTYFFVTGQIVPLLGIREAVRGASPEMRQAIEILFCPPDLLPQFLSGLFCLALFEAAYVAEIVRAGILSVEPGQWEAAHSLGLRRYATLRRVVLPQAVQRMVPPLAGQFISLVKDSSIVSLISIQELTFMANEAANSTGRTFEIWITVAAMYFAVCGLLSLGAARLERRFAASRR